VIGEVKVLQPLLLRMWVRIPLSSVRSQLFLPAAKTPARVIENGPTKLADNTAPCTRPDHHTHSEGPAALTSLSADRVVSEAF